MQLRVRAPTRPRAICAIYATDDRYTDDVHYMGGALRAIDLVDYCHYTQSPWARCPPVLRLLWGTDESEEWLARIAEHEPWLLMWMEEQLDSYWRHGSVRPDYAGESSARR